MESLIQSAEAKIASLPNAVYGDAAAPLEHQYGDGCYVRRITMPKGMLCTSKIHKKRHPFFILSGDVSVLDNKGAEVTRYKAPYYGMTEPGTKRLLYIHEDTVWVTVHTTDKTDLKEIEDEIIEPSTIGGPELEAICRGY